MPGLFSVYALEHAGRFVFPHQVYVPGLGPVPGLDVPVQERAQHPGRGAAHDDPGLYDLALLDHRALCDDGIFAYLGE